MSGRALHFDKQDHKRLDQDWMTGFDNRDRLAQLAQQIQQAQTQVWAALEQDKKAAQHLLAQAAVQQRQSAVAAAADPCVLTTWTWPTAQRNAAAPARKAGRAAQPAVGHRARQSALASCPASTATRADDSAARAGAASTPPQTAEHRQAPKKQQADCAARRGRACRCQRHRCPPMKPPRRSSTGSAARCGLLPLLMPARTTCDALERARTAKRCRPPSWRKTAANKSILHKDMIRQMARALKEDRGALSEQTAGRGRPAALPGTPARAGRRSPARQTCSAFRTTSTAPRSKA
jgi:hypothetical protein